MRHCPALLITFLHIAEVAAFQYFINANNDCKNTQNLSTRGKAAILAICVLSAGVCRVLNSFSICYNIYIAWKETCWQQSLLQQHQVKIHQPCFQLIFWRQPNIFFFLCFGRKDSFETIGFIEFQCWIVVIRINC